MTGALGRLRARVGEEDGMVTAFVVVFTLALLLMAGLVLDGGLTLAAKVQAIEEAQAAARAGAQAIDIPTYRATGQITLDPAQATGLELGGVGADAELSAGDVIGSERSGRGLLCHGGRGGGVAGDRRGPGCLGSGAVDVDARPGQASEGDDEEQDKDEERGQQHQLGDDASGLLSLQTAGQGHGA